MTGRLQTKIIQDNLKYILPSANISYRKLMLFECSKELVLGTIGTCMVYLILI